MNWHTIAAYAFGFVSSDAIFFLLVPRPKKEKMAALIARRFAERWGDAGDPKAIIAATLYGCFQLFGMVGSVKLLWRIRANGKRRARRKVNFVPHL